MLQERTTYKPRQMYWGAAKGRALSPPWWVVEALSLGCNEYSDETGPSASAGVLYTLSQIMSEYWEAQRGLWMLKVHPTLLCGGTKAKGLKNTRGSGLQNWSIVINFKIGSFSCIMETFYRFLNERKTLNKTFWLVKPLKKLTL